MVPILPVEPSEVNAFKTIARLTFSQMQNEHLIAPTHSICRVPQLQLTKTQTVLMTSTLLSYNNLA